MYIYKEEAYGTIERIKELMTLQNLTQEKFADLVGVSPRSVTRWFSGTPIRKKNLITIAEKLECDIAFLECTQEYPNKEHHTTIKLSEPPLTDKYLPLIQQLMSTTTHRFSVAFTPETGMNKTIQGTFIKGTTRYHYETIEPTYTGEIRYIVSLPNGKTIEKSETEMHDFVSEIMKYISYQVSTLDTDSSEK